MFHRSKKNCRNECSCLLNFSLFALNERSIWVGGFETLLHNRFLTRSLEVLVSPLWNHRVIHKSLPVRSIEKVWQAEIMYSKTPGFLKSQRMPTNTRAVKRLCLCSEDTPALSLLYLLDCIIAYESFSYFTSSLSKRTKVWWCSEREAAGFIFRIRCLCLRASLKAILKLLLEKVVSNQSAGRSDTL